MDNDPVHHGEADRWGGWNWREPHHGNHWRTCSYCGCIHPEDLVAEIRENKIHAEWADRKYGWPHKFYITIPDKLGALSWLGGRSGGLKPPPIEELHREGYKTPEELTEEEIAACLASGVTPESYNGLLVGTRENWHSKFYTTHLADPKISDDIKDQIYTMSGLKFTFKYDSVHWEQA